MTHQRLVSGTRRPRAFGLAPHGLGLLALLVSATALAGCASGGSTGSRTQEATGIYTFWPQFPAEPRVQFLESFRTSDDVSGQPSRFEELIYGAGREVLPIAKPYGVEMFDGRIYVCDTQNAAVAVLDIKARQTRVIGASGSARFQSPTDVAVAADGTIYVSDASRGVIFVFDGDERYVTSLGYPGLRPTGIAVHGDELYICDFESQQVHVVDRSNGDRLRTIGSAGDEDGQFVRPLGIDVDDDGNVYTTDVIRCRVQIFDPEGRLINAFGTVGDDVGAFVRPKLISVDRDGHIYVVDAAFANVQIFNRDGDLLMFFGIAGPHPGSMKLPVGICVSDTDMGLFEHNVHPGFKAERLILVTNQFGPHKVSAYALGELREGVTARDIVSAQPDMRSGVQEGVPIDPLTGLPAAENLDPDSAPEGTDGGTNDDGG